MSEQGLHPSEAAPALDNVSADRARTAKTHQFYGRTLVPALQRALQDLGNPEHAARMDSRERNKLMSFFRATIGECTTFEGGSARFTRPSAADPNEDVWPLRS